MSVGHDLARAMQARMHEVTRHHKTVWLELGQITATGDLQVAGLAAVIPKGQYMVSALLSQPNDQDALVGVSISGTNVQHHHAGPPLSPGATVLVGWVDSEYPRAVVITTI